jgi:hypothetical protein
MTEVSELFHSNLYKTKVTVRTHKPDVTQFLTTADEARIIIMADSSNATRNTFIFGTTTADKDIYVGNYESTLHVTSNIIELFDEATQTFYTSNYVVSSNSEAIQKIASFKQTGIDLNANVTVRGSILPATTGAYDIGSSTHRLQNMYLTGSDLHFNEGLMHYDKTCNELEFRHYKKFMVDDSNILLSSNVDIIPNYNYYWCNLAEDRQTYITSNRVDLEVQPPAESPDAVLYDTIQFTLYTWWYAENPSEVFTTRDINEIPGDGLAFYNNEEYNDYYWSNLFNRVYVTQDNSTIPPENTNLLSSNLTSITSNFLGYTSNVIVTQHQELLNTLMPITADELTFKDSQGNFAYLRPTTFNIEGTHLISYRYDET